MGQHVLSRLVPSDLLGGGMNRWKNSLQRLSASDINRHRRTSNQISAAAFEAAVSGRLMEQEPVGWVEYCIKSTVRNWI